LRRLYFVARFFVLLSGIVKESKPTEVRQTDFDTGSFLNRVPRIIVYKKRLRGAK
jgi:hypothetical protein